MTGRPDAAYANLGAAEKTKVHVVMSLLTQESSTAALGAPSFALDPNGAVSTFNFGGNGRAQTRTFRLERDAAGGITVRFETTVRPAILVVRTEDIPLGAGSSISGGYTLTLTAEKLDTIGALDFAACDHTAADQAMNGNVEQKLRTAVNRLPPDFRLGLEPTTTFSAVLN